MILPTKYITEHETILGIGAILLNEMSKEISLSELWEAVKWNSNVGNYERFILALDMFFIFGVIDIRNNKIVKVSK